MADAERAGLLDVAYRTLDTPFGELLLAATLGEAGIATTIRRNRGQEVGAACGQLAAERAGEPAAPAVARRRELLVVASAAALRGERSHDPVPAGVGSGEGEGDDGEVVGGGEEKDFGEDAPAVADDGGGAGGGGGAAGRKAGCGLQSYHQLRGGACPARPDHSAAGGGSILR